MSLDWKWRKSTNDKNRDARRLIEGNKNFQEFFFSYPGTQTTWVLFLKHKNFKDLGLT